VSELSHVYPLGSRVNERGHLELGGCDAVELARDYGTPVYVVVEDDLRFRARAFADALAARHRDCDVLFASKAFPCTAVYRVLADEGLACDVASGGELALALKAGFSAERTYMHGNAKSEAELREALAAGVGHIVLDSRHEIDRLAGIAAEAGIRQDVLIRVTPGVSGDTHQAISTGQADSKFGFSIDQARDAIAALGATLGSTWWDCISTSGHSCSSSSRFAPPSERSRPWATSRSTTSAVAWPRPTRPTSSRPALSGGWRRSSPRCMPSSALTSACCWSPAAPWWPTPL
jgi:diaminopimelate decarboxylase